MQCSSGVKFKLAFKLRLSIRSECPDTKSGHRDEDLAMFLAKTKEFFKNSRSRWLCLCRVRHRIHGADAVLLALMEGLTESENMRQSAYKDKFALQWRSYCTMNLTCLTFQKVLALRLHAK